MRGSPIHDLHHCGGRTPSAWSDSLCAKVCSPTVPGVTPSSIPRHHFIPDHLTPDPAGDPRWQHHRRPDDPAGDPAWLAQLYRRAPLTVALSGIAMWGPQHSVAISPDPELTVRALHALDIRVTDHVLELGTGSGHTTALLAHRIGAVQVTTVEIDAELHLLARNRLATLGLRPHQSSPTAPRLTPPAVSSPARASGSIGSSPVTASTTFRPVGCVNGAFEFTP